jgi:putative ABC transport system permease protein
MDAFVHQVRLAVRTLTRAPAFAATASLTLALGIGLSTAVFTVTDAVLIRRLPVGEQDRIVLLWGATRDGRFANFPVSLDDIREFKRRTRSVGEVAFFGFRGATPAPIRADDHVYPVQLALVSGNLFEVLRSRPALGRALRPEDDVAGAAPVVVLSHRTWQHRFGGDSAIIGRSITMINSGRSSTIVGVMPHGLDYPRATEVWAPIIAYSSAGGFHDIITKELDMLARLRARASPGQARGELTSYFGRPDAPAWQRDVRGVVHSFPDVVLGDTKPALLLVMLASGLLLFITCVNVANLLLVRAIGRVKEFVVRSALGANRGRIVGQLLTESGLLSLAGGVLGVGFAVAAVQAFRALAPTGVPRVDEIGVNGVAVFAAVLITTVAMLLSGLGPALFTSRVEAHDVLRSGSRHTRGRRVRTVAELLVVAQIALATVSLAAAGLMTRSLVKLVQVDLSFEPNRLLVAPLAVRGDQLPDAPKERAALDLVLARVAALPGVRAVSPVYGLPFVGAGGGIDGRPSLPGQSAEDAAKNPIVNLEIAAPNYFAMLGVPVLRGRAFSDEDREGSTPVAIVSSSVARHFWAGDDPIGKRLAGGGGREVTVVGVVPDTRYRELQTARPSVYYPLRQSPFGSIVPTTLLIRTSDAPANLVPALRRAVAEASPGLALVSALSLETLLDAPRAQPRLNAVVLALFAAAALLLAAIGLFAIIATMVRQRTRELGIRMALGATASNVRSIVMVRGLSLAVVGGIVGIAGSLATSRLLSALLFEISPTDGATLVFVAALVLGVASLASFAPARSSMRIDPVIALQSEA